MELLRLQKYLAGLLGEIRDKILCAPMLLCFLLSGCNLAAPWQPHVTTWQACFAPTKVEANQTYQVRALSASTTVIDLLPTADPISLEQQLLDAWRDKKPVTVSAKNLILEAKAKSVIMVAPNGRRLLVSETVRFQPPLGNAITVTPAQDIAPVAQDALQLPKGTTGTVALPGDGKPPLVLETLVPTTGRLLPESKEGLTPRLVPTSDGPVIQVRIARPGGPLDAETQRGLVGCVVPAARSTAEAREAIPTEVLSTKSEAEGTTLVSLRLPENALEPGEGEWWKFKDVVVLVADKDGGNARYGTFWSFWWVTAGLAAAILTAFIFLLIAKMAVAKDPCIDQSKWRNLVMGMFTGKDNNPSLSLFQVFLWTLVTLWALIYVFLRTFSPVSLTSQVMALLGFAGASSVAARWIVSSRAPGQAAPVSSDVQDFSAMLMTDGRLDLLKVQLFTFTLFAVGYVLFRVLESTAFPVLDENLLLLMGVSNLTYLGGKLAEATPSEKAAALTPVRDTVKAQVAELEGKLKALEEEKTKKEQAANASPQPPNRANLEAEVKDLGHKIMEIKGGKNTAGADVVGELPTLKTKLEGLEKALSGASAGVNQSRVA